MGTIIIIIIIIIIIKFIFTIIKFIITINFIIIIIFPRFITVFTTPIIIFFPLFFLYFLPFPFPFISSEQTWNFPPFNETSRPNVHTFVPKKILLPKYLLPNIFPSHNIGQKKKLFDFFLKKN